VSVEDLIDAGLRDKVVLVTGANNPVGIGAATALAFAARGARVLLQHYFRWHREPQADDESDDGPDAFGEAFAGSPYNSLPLRTHVKPGGIERPRVDHDPVVQPICVRSVLDGLHHVYEAAAA